MASILKVDEMQGVTSAGDITITSEGGSATMQLQQGVVKNFLHFDGTGPAAIRDSFNCASLTDAGTGTYDNNFTNNFSNNDYCMGAISRANDQFPGTFEGNNTSSHADVYTSNHSDRAAADADTVMVQLVGDLA